MAITSTTTQTGVASPLPDFIQPHVQQLLDSTGGILQEDGTFEGGLIYEPEIPFEGDRVAGFTTDQTQAHELVREGIGGYAPYMETASGAVDTGLASFSPDVVAGINEQIGQGTGQFSPEQLAILQGQIDAGTGVYNPEANAAIQAQIDSGTGYSIGEEYLNPFQQNVIDTTMAEMSRQQNRDFNTIGSQAADMNAFGGSRHGIYEGETRRGYDDNRNRTLAELNAANFTQAQNAQEQHRLRQLEGAKLMGTNQLSEANTNIAAAGLMGDNQRFASDAFLTGAQISSDTQARASDSALNAARTAGTLGGLEQSYGLTDASALSAVGGQQQGLHQLELDTSYQDYLDARDRPFELASYYSDIINAVPSNQQQLISETTTGNDPNNLSQILGGLGTLASAGEQFGWWGDD